MATRTIKVMGSAYATSGDVTITVAYNGSTVYTGTVPTTAVEVLPTHQPNADINWFDTLCSFNSTTDVSGEIPMTITVSGGTVFFSTLHMNYLGPIMGVEPTDPAVEMNKDDPSTFTDVVVTPTVEHFGDPNTNSLATDGVTNTTLDGNAWNWRTDVPVREDGIYGDWAYPISDGVEFGCDFYVDPAMTILVD